MFSAKHLDLYQVLAPNAYSFKEEFIPVIKRAVQSQVHEVNAYVMLTYLSKNQCRMLKSYHFKPTQIYYNYEIKHRYPCFIAEYNISTSSGAYELNHEGASTSY